MNTTQNESRSCAHTGVPSILSSLPLCQQQAAGVTGVWWRWSFNLQLVAVVPCLGNDLQGVPATLSSLISADLLVSGAHPLTESYSKAVGPVGGINRMWWQSARGVLQFGSVLTNIANDKCRWHNLSDELVFADVDNRDGFVLR